MNKFQPIIQQRQQEARKLCEVKNSFNSREKKCEEGKNSFKSAPDSFE
jgi:hypothetical protein